MGSPQGWTPDDAKVNKGDAQWAVGKDEPVPQDLTDRAGARQGAVDTASQTKTNFNNTFTALNAELDKAGLPQMKASDFSSDQLARTEERAQETLVDHPEAMERFEDAASAANKRREALLVQRDAGEDFGEAAGREVAVRKGYTLVVGEGAPGSGAVDQVWRSQDGSQLILQECKGPSAGLGTREVPLPDGTTITAQQGSTAYTWEIIREDQRLRTAILTDPDLHRGLLDGSVTLRYQPVQPDAVGHVKVTELIIDPSRLDLPGWLGPLPW